MEVPLTCPRVPNSSEETRVRAILGGVVREALRRSGKGGVAVVGGGPEASLLLRWWVAEGIPAEFPSPPLLEAARSLLGRAYRVVDRPRGAAPLPGRPEPTPGDTEAEHLPETPPAETTPAVPLEAPAGVLAGWALALAHDLLPVGTETKTLLILGESRSGAPVLPLGDLYASQVAPFAGGCTPPAILQNADLPSVSQLDRAIEAFLEGGVPLEEALAILPPHLGEPLTAALRRGRNLWNPRVLIPKLGWATLGVELDL